MAIEKMNRLSMTFDARHLGDVLALMQRFQGIHIETDFEATIQPERKADIDREIREIEKTVQEIQSAGNILRRRKSANLLSSMQSAGERELTMRELDQTVAQSNWEQILAEVTRTDRLLQNNRLRCEEAVKNMEALEIWKRLSYNPLDFQKLKRSTALYGSLHNKHIEEFFEKLTALEEQGVAHEVVSEVEDRTYCFIVFHNALGDKVRSYMNAFSFSAEEYPFDKPQHEMAAEIEAEQRQLLEDGRAIDRQIVEQEKYEQILAYAEDFKLNLLLRKRKALEVTYSGDSIAIEGWILENRRAQFEALLAGRIPPGEYALTISPVRDKDIDDVPIKLKNNRIVTAFEQLTAMYSLPKYNETDPTPIMTVFYLIFFGMMVADAGYGLAVFLLGFAIRKFMKIKRGTRSFIDFLYYLSFPIMGWGLIFGSFFGMALPIRLIDVTVDVIPLTIISIVFGYIHIMVGLVLHTRNQIRLKNYYVMLTGSLSWFIAFLGGGLMIAGGTIPLPGLGVLFPAGGALLAIGVGLIVLAPAVVYKKRWYVGLGRGLYSLYGATSYFGDFVSYTRLMALGVAGGSVALAFNTIIGYLPFAAKITLGIVLAVVLHSLNIFLSMLSAYVHSIRLQFIEFFSKFYTGGGKPFEPFKAAEKNVVIKDEV